LIYANGSKPALYGGLVGRMTGIPTIWHCRVADRDPKLDGILFRLITQIVANSQATGRRFRDHGQNKVSIVHNGVNLKWFQDLSVRLPALADGSRQIILVVARLSRWKRHDIILSAFEQIGAAHPSAHLVFIGPSDPDERSWSDQLMALAGKSPFHERIHWMGAVDDPRPWYHAATLVLLASQGEPFGRVLVEAMACGLPVVATRAGGVPEIVRDGIDGLLVPTGNSDVLSAAVIKLLSENELRYKMGANGRERSKAFSIERHVHLMRELFDALICSPIENNR
jgi:glycosyltransferase involved in cell wall biosynthesis